jgi:hypothetical protein
MEPDQDACHIAPVHFVISTGAGVMKEQLMKARLDSFAAAPAQMRPMNGERQAA